MLFETRDLVSGYYVDMDVLHDVSLSVEHSWITTVIGPNGAGKTTLLNTIYGFLLPKRGSILFEGESITGCPPHTMARRGIGYIPQETTIFRFLSTEDNLLIAAGKGRRQAKNKVDEVIQTFPGLREKKANLAGDLSGGQQKMLELAKAMILDPKLLLVDEPTVGLAPKLASYVYERLSMLKEEKGITIFLVDQNVKQAIDLSDYVYVMDLGKIIGKGLKGEFESNLQGIIKSWFRI